MRKAKLTRKIPEYTAYLWDGTFESFRELSVVLGSTATQFYEIKFNANDTSTWLNFGHSEYQNKIVQPNQWIAFTNNGVEVFFSVEHLQRQFDVQEEEEYVGLTPKGRAIVQASKEMS